MKIEIVTLHSQNNNFGTVLQAYALNYYLTEKGYETETLDYKPYYSNGANNNKIRIRIMLTSILFLPYYLKRNKRFNDLIYSVRVSRLYKNYDTLCLSPPAADLYISGSDQIWNPRYLSGQDDTFYLKFTDSDKKMAFSSSAGIELNNSELNQLYENVKDFRYIGVREKITERQLGELRDNVKHVCDTVFLLDRKQYISLESAIILNSKKYVLVYAMEKSAIIDECITYLRESGYEIISVGGFKKKCDYDRFFRDAGPKEFLYLFHHADFILTSSFHGTAFSLIYNKQFVSTKPVNSKERLLSLLGIVDLENRMIASGKEFEKCINERINYTLVNEKMNSFIEESKNFLDIALKEILYNDYI